MKDNYTKYRVVYDHYMYLCSNRRLTVDFYKARVFSSSEEAFRFASFDIRFGKAHIVKYVPGLRPVVVSVSEVIK